MSPFVSQKLGSFEAKSNQDDVRFLTALIESGQVTPVIDRTYPLCETADAIRYLETEQAGGKIVITI